MTVSEYREQRAKEYAKRKILEVAPELADPQVRMRLGRTDKLLIINLMLELADEDFYRVEPLEAI